MRLYKNCKARHNIGSGCKTLRLGTLYGYRAAEDPNIRDEEEGIFHFKMTIKEEVKLSGENANILLPMFHFGGSKRSPYRGAIRAKSSGINIISHDDSGVILTVDSVQIERHAPDQFVFCMSISDLRPSQISSQYDSYWDVAHETAQALADGIGSEILKAITETPELVLGIAKENTENLKIACRHGVVSYLSREITAKDMSLHTMNSLIDKISNIAFIKPPEFATESEYRFAFEITDGENFFPPSSDRIIINSSFAEDMFRRS